MGITAASTDEAPSVAVEAQTEALAAVAEEVVVKAAATATRHQAKADRKRNKRAWEEACMCLMETRFLMFYHTGAVRSKMDLFFHGNFHGCLRLVSGFACKQGRSVTGADLNNRNVSP